MRSNVLSFIDEKERAELTRDEDVGRESLDSSYNGWTLRETTVILRLFHFWEKQGIAVNWDTAQSESGKAIFAIFGPKEEELACMICVEITNNHNMYSLLAPGGRRVGTWGSLAELVDSQMNSVVPVDWVGRNLMYPQLFDDESDR